MAVLGAVLCIVGHEATSLTSMNEITIKRPFPIVTSKNVSMPGLMDPIDNQRLVVIDILLY